MNYKGSDNHFSENKNLGSILGKYLKYWPLFLFSLVLCLLGAWLYLRYYATTLYEIEGQILINHTESGQNATDLDTFKNLGLLKTSHIIDDEIGILTSSSIMEEVVLKYNFNVSYFLEGDLKDVELFGDQVPVHISVADASANFAYGLPVHLKIIDNESFELTTSFEGEDYKTTHKFEETISLPYGTFSAVPRKGLDSLGIDHFGPIYFEVRNPELVVVNYLRNLSVIPVSEDGSLLNLNFISNHKKKGEAILSRLIDTYIENTITRENELAENTIKMIDDRLKRLSGDIERVEDSVVDFKTRNILTDVSRNANNYMDQASDYNQRKIEIETDIQVLESIEKTLLEEDNATTIGGGFAFADRNLVDLISRYNETLLDKQKASRGAGESNPLIASLNETLQALRSSILKSVRGQISALSIARDNLITNTRSIDERIARVPELEKKLLNISREKSTKEGLYLYLMQKREEEILSLAAPISYIRIITPPKAGYLPISPNKKVLYLTGVLFGLMIPISVIYLRDKLNTKIMEPGDLHDGISAPYLGEIATATEKESLNGTLDKTSLNTELFHLLTYNIDFLQNSKSNRTLLVTSTVKGEGKTFIAENLATAYANKGERVVILAFDLREPRLIKNANLQETPGIADFIMDENMAVKEIVQEHPSVENLSVIPSGVVNMYLGKLLSSPRIEVLMMHLKEQFDRIILDTAPIGIVADAFALNPYLDGTIYVVRAGTSKKEYVTIINSIYEKNKLKNTMVLLNDVKRSKNALSYGYEDA